MAQDLDTGTYSQVDASNNAASPNGMPEAMLPSGVNDSWRTSTGAMKRAFDRDHAVSTTTVGGTGNAITLTYATAPTAYVQGQKFAFKATAANTAATTVNVSALGVKNVFRPSSGGPIALVGGEIGAGNIVEIEYDGTQFQLLSASTFDTDAKAWVYATGAGAILASGGISSVVRNSVGNYSIGFTTAFTSANFGATVTPDANLVSGYPTGRLAGSININLANTSTGALVDANFTLSVYGRQ